MTKSLSMFPPDDDDEAKKRNQRLYREESAPSSESSPNLSKFMSGVSRFASQVIRKAASSKDAQEAIAKGGRFLFEQYTAYRLTNSTFISYRRRDTYDLARRIQSSVDQRFGPDTAVLDSKSMPQGVDFRDYLIIKVRESRVIVALIGDAWFDCDESYNRLIDDPNDFIRVEIETALECSIPVVPVLVSPVTRICVDELPASLKALAFMNFIHVDSEADLAPQIEPLLNSVKRHVLGNLGGD